MVVDQEEPLMVVDQEEPLMVVDQEEPLMVVDRVAEPTFRRKVLLLN
jgi:hypothetical protein